MSQSRVLIRSDFRLSFVYLLLGVILATSCAAATIPREEEWYLRGPQGPYRGRVIDAQTKNPISGAAVVAVWNIDMPVLVERHSVVFDVVEVLTDTEGYFVVDAPEIEGRAPRNTKFPVFTIFKPGYRYFPGWFADHKDDFTIFPFGRFLNHFHHPLRPWNQAGLSDIFSRTSSVIWAQTPNQSFITDSWSWQETRKKFHLAFTSEKKEDRDGFFGPSILFCRACARRRWDLASEILLEVNASCKGFPYARWLRSCYLQETGALRRTLADLIEEKW